MFADEERSGRPIMHTRRAAPRTNKRIRTSRMESGLQRNSRFVLLVLAVSGDAFANVRSKGRPGNENDLSSSLVTGK
jgi:hypothetical protein